jgi:acyl carrier protein
MTQQTSAERELAELIVSCLNLEQRRPDEIAPDAPLFGGELGLDSIDALELALAISKRYGFALRSDSSDNRRIFSSLRELSAHVERQRAALCSGA